MVVQYTNKSMALSRTVVKTVVLAMQSTTVIKLIFFVNYGII